MSHRQRFRLFVVVTHRDGFKLRWSYCILYMLMMSKQTVWLVRFNEGALNKVLFCEALDQKERKLCVSDA